MTACVQDALTTIGVLGQGGCARVDHKTITNPDGSTAEVAVKVVVQPEQQAASPDDAASTEAPSEADADASADASAAASSAGDPAPAAACSLAPATWDPVTCEDEDEENDEAALENDEDEGEVADDMDLSPEALRAAGKSRALRLEGAVLNKLRGQPHILGAKGWQGDGRSGLILPLAKGGSLQKLLWCAETDRPLQPTPSCVMHTTVSQCSTN